MPQPKAVIKFLQQWSEVGINYDISQNPTSSIKITFDETIVPRDFSLKDYELNVQKNSYIIEDEQGIFIRDNVVEVNLLFFDPDMFGIMWRNQGSKTIGIEKIETLNNSGQWSEIPIVNLFNRNKVEISYPN